ncbi:O-fucosyltransferase family protein [Actinidia rufa]|uniref:O-fucosyltransferase family protein n=1 Tax=Actinidia rufa TaxID=165716 RepID=A0A7J0GBU5_9ERIC|nr:O-fucosyltransferase family protein [Actinidia rufa]
MDRESSSSDEEEDRKNLIGQNERPKPKSPIRSTFHVDEFKDRMMGNARRFTFPTFTFNKRYLFAIFLPLFIIIVYFTTDIKNLFRTRFSNLSFDSSINRMRESELRALYLLREQQLGLFKLWNRTFVTESNSNSNSNSTVVNPVNSTLNSSSALFEDFKSALLSQISFNKQMQQVLLSSHQFGNWSDLADNFMDPSLGSYASLDRCRKVDQNLSQQKKIEWKPRSDKYLFTICLSGQMSNHLICLEKHMFFAALLNRVLVIPSTKLDYQFDRVLDMDHINKCLGRKVVVEFDEFAEAKKSHLHIDKFMCYFSLPQPCFIDDEHVKKLKSLGISMNKLEAVWVEDVKKPTKRTMQDVMAKFSSNDDVIAIGDVFFADAEQDLVMQPGGPLAHNCRTLIEPSRIIMLTAQRFIQTFLGERYVALHFRRHGFLKFCNAKKPSCFFPIPQAADCISRVVERANTPVIYLSTDAAESETSLLQSLVVLNGEAVPLITRPARNFAEKWDALLYRHDLGDDPQVEAMLDKNNLCNVYGVHWIHWIHFHRGHSSAPEGLGIFFTL